MDYLSIARKAASQGAEVSMKYWRQQLSIDTKSNERDLVTHADKEAGNSIEAYLREATPEFGIISEENESIDPSAEYVWTVDPIDGTVNYASGLQMFGTIIALLHNGVPIVCALHFPALKEEYWAEQGKGAWVSYDGGAPEQLAVSTTATIQEARFGSGLGYSNETRKQNVQAFEQLVYETDSARMFFCGAYDAANIAAGRLDFYLHTGNTTFWDFAPIECLVKEAGGNATALDGENIRFGEEGGALITNGVLHAVLFQKLNS